MQCCRKLLLKVMHYNIVLLPKKILLGKLLFMESNRLLLLSYFLNLFKFFILQI